MAPLILIAHEEAAIREAAEHAAASAGYEVVAVSNGARAREVLLADPAPAALVVDVGLEGLAGYELVDEIRERELPTKTVLIASVYSKTAYKRKPTSLYGADDYVEQHHVVDMLAAKLAALVPAPRRPRRVSVHDRASLSAEERRDAERVREAGQQRDQRRPTPAPDAVARARALARIIVSDMVLYNGTEVEHWVRGGASGELPPRILRDLDEARRLFSLGMPAELAGRRDFVLEALMEFLGARGQGA